MCGVIILCHQTPMVTLDSKVSQLVCIHTNDELYKREINGYVTISLRTTSFKLLKQALTIFILLIALF